MTFDMEGLLNEDTVSSPILFDIMKRNIANNLTCLSILPDIQELEWGPQYEEQASLVLASQPQEFPYDLLVGSDLTYHSSTATSLFWTVSRLLTSLSKEKQHANHDDDVLQNVGTGDCENDAWPNNKIKFITAHEHRLESSTQETLNVAVNKFGLHHKELFQTGDKKHSIWMFTLPD